MITEACHFLNGDGKVALLTWIGRRGLSLQPVGMDDLGEIATVLERYADRQMDFADATLVWLADLINTLDVMTIDRRDFRVYRSRGGDAFNLVLVSRETRSSSPRGRGDFGRSPSGIAR